MAYTNSPLTYVLPLPLTEDVRFELYNPIDGTAWLLIPAGGIRSSDPKDTEVTITFRACNTVPDIDMKTVKQVVASEMFEIEVAEKIKIKDIQLSLPLFNWDGDVKKIRLYEQDRGARWQRTAPCQVVRNGANVDHFQIDSPQHYSYYAAAYEL
jgi:hypothetical protein